MDFSINKIKLGGGVIPLNKNINFIFHDLLSNL